MFKKRFFAFLEAEGAGGTGGTGNTGTGNAGGTNPPTNQSNTSEPTSPSTPPSQEKQFTQADLNRIAAQEKRQGASAALKALGFDSEDAAKEFIEAARAAEDAKKSDLTKAQEKLEAEKKAKVSAQTQVEALERKIAVMSQGASADKVDDIVLLASAKVNDKKSFEDALQEVKQAYPIMFDAPGSSGTGTGGTPPRGGNPGGGLDNIGKRLAEAKKQQGSLTQNKSSYFRR